MPSLVYICRNGKNPELIYSIRSACRNLKFDKLIIAGGKPDEIEPDIYIPVPQNKNKFKNAYDNILAVCENPITKDNLILMNDDFFILNPPSTLENDRGDYRAYKDSYKIPFTGKNEIHYQIENTIKLIENLDTPKLNYELHAPMTFEKNKMKELFDRFKENIYNYQIRSLYKNMFFVPSQTLEDTKYHNQSDNIDLSKTFISTSDRSFNYGKAGVMLRSIFTSKSQYEK